MMIYIVLLIGISLCNSRPLTPQRSPTSLKVQLSLVCNLVNCSVQRRFTSQVITDSSNEWLLLNPGFVCAFHYRFPLKTIGALASIWAVSLLTMKFILTPYQYSGIFIHRLRYPLVLLCYFSALPPDTCIQKMPVIAAVIIRILYRNALIAKYPCLFTTRSLVCVFFRCGFIRKISSVLQQASYSFGLTYLRFHIFIWFAVHRFMKRLILQPVSLTVA